jgi:hypothetical protein
VKDTEDAGEAVERSPQIGWREGLHRVQRGVEKLAA